MRRLSDLLGRGRDDDRPGNLPAGSRPTLVYALDGFLGAGSAPRLAAAHLAEQPGEVLASFDIDDYYDYRARRPPMVFDRDHYTDYEGPTLQVRLQKDEAGTPYLLLAGPEPDFRWEQFITQVHDLIEEYDVELSVGMGAVPMGVPHTRPLMITAHGNRSELVDRRNLWSGQLMVPASAQALLEYRLGEWGHDAVGYVVHVPQYLAQVDYPTASVALLDAVVQRTGLQLDIEPLRARQAEAIADIEQQIIDQDGGEVLAGLEEQYDAFTRGATESLLADDEALPSGDELGRQFEQFLARIERRDQGE
ncbi:MAG: proteasome assembly chaperone family protein [Nocardioidaceae bacterium]